MLKVGLTGNIGSGKSFVSNIFNKIGAPVFHADSAARALLENEGIKNQVRNIFGIDVFTANGEISRPELARLVFTTPSLLKQLNDIIHPLVRKEYQFWCEGHVDAPYTLYEAAILFESGYYREMDKMICVVAPAALRIKRVMERDQVTREVVESRMANQWEEEEKTSLSDFIIFNDGIQPVYEQVININNQLIQPSTFNINNIFVWTI